MTYDDRDAPSGTTRSAMTDHEHPGRSVEPSGSGEGDKFLSTLLDGKPDDAYLLIWKLQGRSSAWFTEINDASAYVTRQADADLYVGAGLSPRDHGRGNRCSADEVIGIPALWADIDFGRDGHQRDDYPPTEVDALRLIDSLPLKPSILIHSGHGLQGWWLFHEPWIFEDAVEREQAETFVRRWQRMIQMKARRFGWAVDSTHDLARVLRVPGTINHKSDPMPVRLVACESDLRYGLDEIEELLPTDDPADTRACTPIDADGLRFSPSASPPVGDLAALYGSNAKFKATWDHQRLDLKDPSPSGYCMALAHYAVLAGWSDQAVVDLLIAWRREHHPEGNTKADRPDWFARIIGKVRSSLTPVMPLLDMVRKTGDSELVFDHVEALAELPEMTYAPVKTELARLLGKNLNLKSLDRAVRELRASIRGAEDNGLTKKLADDIRRDDHFATDAARRLYWFHSGRYVEGGQDRIEQRVQTLLEEAGQSKQWSTRRSKEVVEYIRIGAPLLWECPPTDRINVQNGILHLDSRALHPHSPEFLSPVQLPVQYDRDATCPEWERFVHDVFPADAQDVAWEILADLMTPDRSRQVAILLYGPGGNGKSTFLRAAATFIGRDNVSSASLHDLEANRFSKALLLGKLANICSDLPSGKLAGTSTFKAITGGDRIQAEFKFRDQFQFVPFTRMVFAANNPPRSDDASYAFYRRWLVVPFDRTFEEGSPEFIPGDVLADRLADPGELSGALNRALDMLPRLRKRGFTDSVTLREASQELQEFTDPFAAWLEQATVMDTDAYIPKATLRETYRAECRRTNRAPLSDGAFGHALKRLRPSITDGQRTIDGKREWVWLGIDSAPDC